MVKHWTKEECDFLINNYGKLTRNELAVALNRTLSAIKSKLKYLNLNKQDLIWTDVKLEFLRNNYKNYTCRELSELLGTKGGENTIQLKIKELGLSKQAWSPEEIDFLLETYKDHTYNEIAAAINKTASSVRHKVRRLKLLKIGDEAPQYKPKVDGNKVCRKCGRELPKSEFRRKKLSETEIFSYCNDCVREFNRTVSYNYRVNKRIENTDFYKEKQEIKKIKQETADKLFKCPVCELTKPGTEFYFNNKTKKRYTYCKDCEKIRREKYKENKIKKIIEGKAW